MKHIVAKQNDDDTWDIEIQTVYQGRLIIMRVPRGVINIEALKVKEGHIWTINVCDGEGKFYE